jgi:hypothetical protein
MSSSHRTITEEPIVAASGQPTKSPSAYVDLSNARPRTCLRCSEAFVSRSSGNRICPRCAGRKPMQEV